MHLTVPGVITVLNGDSTENLMSQSAHALHARPASTAGTGRPRAARPAAPSGPPRSRVDPFSDTVLDDPYTTYTHLREWGPAVWLQRYGLWAVAGFSAARQVLTD